MQRRSPSHAPHMRLWELGVLRLDPLCLGWACGGRARSCATVVHGTAGARSRPGSGWYSRDPELDWGLPRPGTLAPGLALATLGIGLSRGRRDEGPGGNPGRSGAVDASEFQTESGPNGPGTPAHERPPCAGWRGAPRARRSRPFGISRPVSLTGKPGRKGDLSLQPCSAVISARPV
jgi:hypothetical protein